MEEAGPQIVSKPVDPEPLVESSLSRLGPDPPTVGRHPDKQGAHSATPEEKQRIDSRFAEVCHCCESP